MAPNFYLLKKNYPQPGPGREAQQLAVGRSRCRPLARRRASRAGRWQGGPPPAADTAMGNEVSSEAGQEPTASQEQQPRLGVCL